MRQISTTPHSAAAALHFTALLYSSLHSNKLHCTQRLDQIEKKKTTALEKKTKALHYTALNSV